MLRAKRISPAERYVQITLFRFRGQKSFGDIKFARVQRMKFRKMAVVR